MDQGLMDLIRKEKIVAIIRGISQADLVPVTEQLIEGGIRLIEITLDQKDPQARKVIAQSLDTLRSRFSGRANFGVGTVLSVQDAEAAIEAGAEYLISPDTNPAVIQRTKELGVLSIPGALTPSEITAAYRAGADMVKLFPASQMGPAYIKAVRGPLGHIPLMATGGITAENMADYLAAGCAGAGIGGNLVNAARIAAGDYAFIAHEARKYRKALEAFLQEKKGA